MFTMLLGTIYSTLQMIINKSNKQSNIMTSVHYKSNSYITTAHDLDMQICNRGNSQGAKGCVKSTADLVTRQSKGNYEKNEPRSVVERERSAFCVFIILLKWIGGSFLEVVWQSTGPFNVSKQAQINTLNCFASLFLQALCTCSVNPVERYTIKTGRKGSAACCGPNLVQNSFHKS